MLTGCLARLLGSQFSNFTFNISIHLPKYHNTRPLSEVYNRFFRRPGFALFEDLESGFWSKMGTRLGMYRMGDYENKFRDYGTEGKPSSQPAMQHSVVFVSQNIYCNNELTLYQSPSSLDEIDTLYFVLSAPSTVVSSRGNNFLSDKHFLSLIPGTGKSSTTSQNGKGVWT